MNYNFSENKNRGFTLIEMMVSVAIFTIIMTVGIGSLVSVMKKYEVSQQNKQASDTLNFVLESMTRELRLGYSYSSMPSSGTISSTGSDGTYDSRNESNAHMVGFFASDNRGYIVYEYEDDALYRILYTDQDNNGSYETLVRSPLTDVSQVLIKEVRITVMNAGDVNDQRQALVWLQILAAPTARPDAEYTVQTLASQRILDA